VNEIEAQNGRQVRVIGEALLRSLVYLALRGNAGGGQVFARGAGVPVVSYGAACIGDRVADGFTGSRHFVKSPERLLCSRRAEGIRLM
jgi:hypothetical protein